MCWSRELPTLLPPKSLGKLPAAFKPGGSTTAGNSSQVSDGAAAVLLASRVKAQQLGLPILGVFRAFAVRRDCSAGRLVLILWPPNP